MRLEQPIELVRDLVRRLSRHYRWPADEIERLLAGKDVSEELMFEVRAALKRHVGE